MTGNEIKQTLNSVKESTIWSLQDAYKALCTAAEGSIVFGESFKARVEEVQNLVGAIERDSHSLK